MTPFEWAGPALELVGKLSAMPLKISDRAVTAATYLGASFGAAVVGLFNEGLARPLSELAESKLQKIKSVDIADAAEAHNKALLKRAEVNKVEAGAERTLSEARVNDAKAKGIDARLEIERFEQGRLLAEERRDDAEARLAAAVWKLKEKGGELYLDSPPEDDD